MNTKQLILSIIFGATLNGCGKTSGNSSTASSSPVEIKKLIAELIEESNLNNSDYEQISDLSYAIWQNREIATPIVNTELQRKHSFSAANSLLELAGNIGSESSIEIIASYLSGQETWTENTAAASLAWIGSDKAKQAVLNKFDETYNAPGLDFLGSLKAIGYLKIKSALPQVHKILEDDNPASGSYNHGVARTAIETLAYIGDSSSLRLLEPIAKRTDKHFAFEAKTSMDLITKFSHSGAPEFTKDKSRYRLTYFSSSSTGWQVYDPSTKKFSPAKEDEFGRSVYYAAHN